MYNFKIYVPLKKRATALGNLCSLYQFVNIPTSLHLIPGRSEIKAVAKFRFVNTQTIYNIGLVHYILNLLPLTRILIVYNLNSVEPNKDAIPVQLRAVGPLLVEFYPNLFT